MPLDIVQATAPNFAKAIVRDADYYHARARWYHRAARRTQNPRDRLRFTSMALEAEARARSLADE
jgi:cell division septum initiation protein DivIVA